MQKIFDLFLKFVGAFFLILVLIPFVLIGLIFIFIMLIRVFPLILLLLFILAVIFYFYRKNSVDKNNLSENTNDDDINRINKKRSFYRKKVVKSYKRTDTSSDKNENFYREETTIEFDKSVNDFNINGNFPDINEIISSMGLSHIGTDKNSYTEKIIENLNTILAKTDNLEQKKELTKSVNNILHYLTELEKVKQKIPKFEKYEMNKLIQEHLLKILTLGSKSDESSIDKVIRGVKIIENEIEELYSSYIINVDDQLDKEIEFLKRKYGE